MISTKKINLLNNKQNDEDDNYEDNPIQTSVTIKTKNYEKIKKVSMQLKLPVYQIAILCMDYFVKNNHIKLEKKLGTIQYNEPDEYATMALIYENKNKFELFLSLKIINRLSISLMMDKAIDWYLSLIIEILLKIEKDSNKFDSIILSITNMANNFTKKVKQSHFIQYLYEFIVT